MTKIEILESLIANDLAERRRPHDEVWWRLNRGEISKEEAIAERGEHESEEDARRKAELFAPPSEQEHEEALDDLLSRYYEVREPNGPRTTIGLWSGALGLAAAAVVAWWAFRPPPQDSESVPLPSYVLAWDKQWSGDVLGPTGGLPPRDCVIYNSALDLRLLIRPEVEWTESVDVAMSAQREGGGPAVWVPIAAPTVGSRGVLTIEQRVADLGLAPGSWAVKVYVVRQGERPKGLQDREPGLYDDAVVMQNSVCIE
ncbi:MAG: hypothetical protein K0V04_08960 [Deltaproteobacteria bacterium]|nr:hypothetical protein [Deltaproteobacteria bacterium]